MGTGQGCGQAGTSICRAGSGPVRGTRVRHVSGMAAGPWGRQPAGGARLGGAHGQPGRAVGRWRPMHH